MIQNRKKKHISTALEEKKMSAINIDVISSKWEYILTFITESSKNQVVRKKKNPNISK